MNNTAEIVYRKSAGKEGRVTLGGRFVIGRSDACDLQLQDRGVSKQHCEIRAVGGSWVIRDLGSKNGTIVNGRKITHDLWLRDGDRIAVGPVTLSFCAGAPMAAAAGAVRIAPPSAGDDSRICSVIHDAAAPFIPVAAHAGGDALKRDYERLRLAFEVLADLSAHADKDTLLARILDKTLQILPAERIAIILAAEDGSLVPVAFRTEGGDDSRIVISQTILEKVIRGGEALLTADALRDARFTGAKSILARGVRSAMCVPIRDRTAVIGAIHLEAAARAGAFTDKDLVVLASIAAQAGVAIENARLTRTMAEEMLTRERLSRYLSPVLVERVVTRQTALTRGGSLRRATILFADIRDFTRLTASSPPEAVVALLNGFFHIAAESIFVHNGVLDKFIGDAVMALWGAAEERPDDAAAAIGAAADLQRGIAAFSEAEVRAGRRPISIGVGLDTGDVVVGDMGSGRRMEFTAIGHAVNMASRLCSRAAGGEILVSAATAAAAGPGCGFALSARGPAAIKGHDEPVEVFAVDLPQ